MSVPFMWVDGNLTLVLNNRTYQVLPDHINYKMILEALPTATADELLNIVDVEKAVATFSDGLVEIKNGQVTYEGEIVHGRSSWSYQQEDSRVYEQGSTFSASC